MKTLYIIGAGDTGRELLDLADRINQHKGEAEWLVKGFIDEDAKKNGESIDGIKVVGTIDFLNQLEEDVYAICAIGNGVVKERIVSKIVNPRIRFATLIDPSVTLCKGATCGEGSFIYAGCSIAINVNIGKHVYISFNSSIGHDSIIEDYCSAFPGVNVSGKVLVKHSTTLGTGAKIIQGLTVESCSLVGAGAVIVKDIEQRGTYAGVPAKRIK